MAPRFVLPVHYDFASSICYVAHRVMEEMAGELADMGIALAWTPIDLSRVTGLPRGRAIEGPPRDNALRVARELGVAVRVPPRFLESRAAHAVALALAGDVKEAAWRERVWSAAFEESRDVGDEEELERLGRDVGIAVAALADDAAFDRLDRETDQALAAGVSGVPTFRLAFPLGGIQDRETMRLLFRRWVERKGE